MADNSTNYLALYDAAADADKFALVRQWIANEPLPFFKQLREQRPILVTPECTLVARFDDVREVLSLPKIFTVALYLPKMGDGIYLMAHDDDALHTREKSLMQALLNRDELPQVRTMVADIAKTILDQAGNRIEVVNQFCRMVPATLVQDYFGLDGADKKDLIEWSYWNQYDTFHNQPFDCLPADKKTFIEQRHNETGELLNKYITELIVRRSLAVGLEKANLLRTLWLKLRVLARLLMGKKHDSTLRDDTVTRMLRSAFPEAVDFDIKRLGVNAGGLLIGAIETTSQAVAQVLQYVLENPARLDQAKTAAAQNDTAAFDGIVWEALRFVPIAPYLFRKTANDYTVAGGTDHATTLRAGSYVLPLTQSAMFDARAFENPDEFIPSRNWYHYFHFGFGSHECLGRYIGMVMIPEMVRQVLLRPGIAAQGAIDYKQGPFPEAYQLVWS
jgi:cytochrome P450